MRKIIHITAIMLFTGITCYAQSSGPGAYLSSASYNTPSGKSYFETYLSVKGKTVVYAKIADGKYQAKVNVVIKFMQHDSVMYSGNYNLLSPVAVDSVKKLDFNGSQRYWLPAGQYMAEIKLTDKNNSAAKVASVRGKIIIGYPKDSTSISDAELIESYKKGTDDPLSKSGYDLTPYINDNYYPPGVNSLKFYVEVYNTYKLFGNGKFALRYFIKSADTHVPLYEYNYISVYKADTVIPVLGGFNIEKLPTGKYNLVIALVDKKDHIVLSRGFNFFRNNPGMGLTNKDLDAINVSGTFVASITRKDSLLYYVQALTPLATIDERDFINQVNGQTDTKQLQQFLYNFWATRNPLNPAEGWHKYYAQVKVVDKKFGTITKRGYQTDRGRVYLEYGSPSQRVKSDVNPSSYPYEIWEYYQLPDGQVDKKFVFYEPSLATNDYVLLHSDARGEVQNPQWQLILNSRMGQPQNVDQTSMPDPYGENALDEFSNPR